MKTKLVVCVLAFSAFHSLGVADQYKGARSPYAFSDSGEITGYTTSVNYLPGYASVAIVNGGFETFAAQSTIPFFLDTWYDYTLGQIDSQGHELTQGAALLYYDFAKGILPGFDYTNPDSYYRIQDAGALQAALWNLQGYGNANGSFPTGSTGNEFYDYAVSQLGSDVTAANNGKYDVDIIQIWDDQHQQAQNQFVVPAGRTVPDGYSTAALLIVPFAGLMSLRKRFGFTA